eukprot:2477654-Alexandrium_andersonii.AAC.1
MQSLNCAGPGTASEVVPGSSDGVDSAEVFARTPNAKTKAGIEGVRSYEIAGATSSNPQY